MTHRSATRGRVRWTAAPKEAPAGMLGSVEWGYVSGAFAAFGHRFGIRTTDPVVGEYLDRAFAAFSDDGAPNVFYSLLDCGPPDQPDLLYYGDRLIMRGVGQSRFLIHLMWHINREAIERCPDLVVLHAAVAERDGVGVLLPGQTEAGKTTLVAGLVASGFRYLSDEAAAIDPRTLLVRAYPKPLSIDPGSWQVLRTFEPQVGDRVRPFLSRQWLLPADAIRPDAVTTSATPRVLIATRYVEGAGTRLEPASRPSLLMDLAPLTFGFQKAPHRDLAVLAALLQRCACYHLTVGDLAGACDLVTEVVDRARRSVTGTWTGPAGTAAIDGATVASRRSEVPVASVDEEIVLYDPEAEALHHLDGIGAQVWSELDGVRSLSEIAMDLATAWGADPRQVEGDVVGFARRLASAGLLAGVEIGTLYPSDGSDGSSERRRAVVDEPRPLSS